MNRAVVTIPRGFQSDGTLTTKAELRELTGHDEESVADADGLPTPLRTTALLERLVSFDGTPDSQVPQTVRNLAAGDRVALVLGIRRMLFGDRIDCLVSCPSCGSEMSVELFIHKLTQSKAPWPTGDGEFEVDGRKLKLRPVAGADLESASEPPGGADNEEKLVRSCITFSDPPLPERLSEGLLSAVSEKLGELDPQADLQLDLACPACAVRFQTPFFAEGFVLTEIERLQPQLEKEVHWIAFNYNWTENEILSLPITKRKRYVDLINRTLSGEAV
jgi:hypothetical protein